MVKKLIYGLLLIITGIILAYILGVFAKTEIQNDNKNIITSFFTNNIKIGKDFTLIDHNNKPFTFSSVNGKPSLIYFGFTHCPDFCPASLHIMDSVSKEIDVNRIFISLDPQRDTPKALSDYVGLYTKGLIAVTDSHNKIDSIAKQWKIYYSLNKKNDTDQSYTVDHSIYMYLTNKQGNPIAMIHPEATPSEIITFIKDNQAYFD